MNATTAQGCGWIEAEDPSTIKYQRDKEAVLLNQEALSASRCRLENPGGEGQRLDSRGDRSNEYLKYLR